MKLVMSERTKHRIVGIAVLLSIAAIFLPAILKKSNQPLESMSRVAVRLPARPPMIQVKQAEAEQLFKTVKVAKVTVPKPTAVAGTVKIARAASLEPVPSAPVTLPEIHVATQPKLAAVERKAVESKVPVLPRVVEKKPAQAVKSLPLKVQQAKLHKPASIVRGGYAVQVANFTSLQNAQLLIAKLRTRGFSATYVVDRAPRELSTYRVLVGRSLKREEVVRIQSQLASTMRLRGFVVPAEVG